MRQILRGSAVLLLIPRLLSTPDQRSCLQTLVARQAEVRGTTASGAVQSLRLLLMIEEPGFAVRGRYVCDRAGRVRVDIFEFVDIVRVELSDAFRTWRGIDAATGRITLRRDHRALHPDADPRPRWVETRLSDFRRIDGLLFPFVESQTDRGTSAWLGTTQVLKLEVDPCLSDAEMRRPASSS